MQAGKPAGIRLLRRGVKCGGRGALAYGHRAPISRRYGGPAADRPLATSFASSSARCIPSCVRGLQFARVCEMTRPEEGHGITRERTIHEVTESGHEGPSLGRRGTSQFAFAGDNELAHGGTRRRTWCSQLRWSQTSGECL